MFQHKTSIFAHKGDSPGSQSSGVIALMKSVAVDISVTCWPLGDVAVISNFKHILGIAIASKLCPGMNTRGPFY